MPSAIFQNGRKCSLVNMAGAAFQRPMSAPGVGVERAETPVRVQGPNIIGVDGNVLAMKGINWFGFDVRGQSSDNNVSSLEPAFILSLKLCCDNATLQEMRSSHRVSPSCMLCHICHMSAAGRRHNA